MKILMICMLAWAAPLPASETGAPYAGQDLRAIKSLSAAEIQGYLDGSGMGFAKAAELNHFPGPKHVLELSGELELSAAQISETRKIHQAMRKRAVELGRRLVGKERLLDRRFAERSISDGELKTLLTEIAGLEGEIRYTHLAAHLAQERVLSGSQVRHYDRLRGYGAGHKTHEH